MHLLRADVAEPPTADAEMAGGGDASITGLPVGPHLTVENVYRCYSGYVAQLAFRLLGRDGEVDDLVQDVFVRCLGGLSSLRSPRAIRAWLGTVTVRLALRRLRRRRLRSLLGLDGPEVSELYDELPAPGTSPEDQVLLSRVYQALDRLPAADRIAWTLRYVEGEALDQVATLCRCSLATAKRRIVAARKALEAEVGDE